LVVTVDAPETVACAATFLDQQIPCVSNGAGSWSGALGVPAMVAPGAYTVTLSLEGTGGQAQVVPVGVVVGEGRYDYERLDLPSDRQALLDPALSQAERDKIAALRTVRTPVRYWSYPLLRPVDAAVTSYFGSRRSYGYGFGSYHAGTDFDGEIGTPIVAPADGVVLLAEPLVVRGNAILIDHGWGIISGYWHLSRIGVAPGQVVAQGQQIGLMGNTGLSTGAHLHWELWVNGVAVNGLTWLQPDAPPVALGATP
jgi:murein DD-endopeptidase MepM/ murein hydrolase activator NlpD